MQVLYYAKAASATIVCFDFKHPFVFNKVDKFCFQRNSEYFSNLTPLFPGTLMFQLRFG